VVSDFDHQISISKSVLIGNYPNPFNPETIIRFFIETSGNVTIDVYNIRGQKVRGLINDFIERDEHTVLWNAKDDNDREVSSGIYFYQMLTNEGISTKRMILLK